MSDWIRWKRKFAILFTQRIKQEESGEVSAEGKDKEKEEEEVKQEAEKNDAEVTEQKSATEVCWNFICERRKEKYWKPKISFCFWKYPAESEDVLCKICKNL